MFKKNKKIVAHNGSFHADDVFAVATIMLANPKEKFEVVRTRDEARINNGDFVVDVGRIYDENIMRFDHHQEGGAGKRESGIPYASFGLVWKKFGEKICGAYQAKIIDKGLVSFIDAGDNGVDLVEEKKGVSNFSISTLVAIFNSTSLEKDTNDKTFLDLVELAKKIIKREIALAEEYIFGEKEIIEAYKRAEDKRFIVLDKQIDKVIINDTLQEFPEVLFVIHPYHKIGSALRTVRKNPSSFESRKNLPKAWAGKINEEFQKITGVKDALFCHNACFVANAKSKEGAIALAKLALEDSSN
ncbi:MAG: MYG1 family protein [Candidatus Paceibacterota bacterium]